MPTIEALVQSMQVQWQRHEVIANNLANATTPGFKRDDLAMVPDAVVLASRSANAVALPAGGDLIQWTDFSQGFVQETGRSLDAAVNGPGFFVVDTPAGRRYTRAGAFTVGRDGLLVSPMGATILGTRGPIAVTSSRISIGAAGEVLDSGRLVDTLMVVDFPRPYQFMKEGQTLFAPAAGSAEPTPAKGYEIVGGALESSNTGTVQMMVSMIEVLRTYEVGQRALQAIEEANQHATSDIGKVA
jgi:flagellar basal-body rod protein FlgG